jgi:cell division protein FtsB
MKYIVIVLSVLVGLAFWRVDYLTKQNTTLELEKKAYLQDMEGYKNAQISSSKLIKELQSAKAQSKTDTDCSDTPLPEYVTRVFDKLK